jgi:putative PIN family toxin of toxin-antitoxin system
MIKVFIDTSVLFSAIYSSTGASAKLVSLVRLGYLFGITTQTVIKELEDNISKLKGMKIDDINNFISNNNILVYEEISQDEVLPFIGVVEEKDAHVVSGAILTESKYLLTLDKKHLDNSGIRKKVEKVKILSPKEMLQILIK